MRKLDIVNTALDQFLLWVVSKTDLSAQQNNSKIVELVQALFGPNTFTLALSVH